MARAARAGVKPRELAATRAWQESAAAARLLALTQNNQRQQHFRERSARPRGAPLANPRAGPDVGRLARADAARLRPQIRAEWSRSGGSICIIFRTSCAWRRRRRIYIQILHFHSAACTIEFNSHLSCSFIIIARRLAPQKARGPAPGRPIFHRHRARARLLAGAYKRAVAFRDFCPQS